MTRTSFFLFIAMTLFSGVQARAQVSNFGRPASSQNVSWTLGDWLAQKEKFRLMDQWLAVHKQAKTTEFILEGSQSTYDRDSQAIEKSYKANRYAAALNITIFGIEAGLEDSKEDKQTSYGQLNLRLLGTSARSTNVGLGYGLRKIDDETADTDVQNQFAAVNTQIYILNFFGLDGEYKKFFKSEDNADTEFEGERGEYGAFVDIGFIRLFGKGFVDKTYSKTSAGVRKNETRDGFDLGFQLYF